MPLLAIAHALDGFSRAEAAQLAGMERQALGDAAIRFNDEAPRATIAIMNLFLADLARQLEPATHAVLVLDRAGWHGSQAAGRPSERHPAAAARPS